ncbi:hypothetical protein C8J56DRAFT_896372 [Mycena floridula]|nr:hypothetical protein C8J56DRAFT_896372 [Mycena floridula]
MESGAKGSNKYGQRRAEGNGDAHVQCKYKISTINRFQKRSRNRDEEPEEDEAEYWEPSKVGCFIGSVVLGSMRGLGGAMGEREVHDTGPRTLDLSGVQFTPTSALILADAVYRVELLGALLFANNSDNPRQKAPVVKEGLWGNVVGRFNKGNEGSDTESLKSESPSSSTNPPSYPGVREEKRVGSGGCLLRRRRRERDYIIKRAYPIQRWDALISGNLAKRNPRSRRKSIGNRVQ